MEVSVCVATKQADKTLKIPEGFLVLKIPRSNLGSSAGFLDVMGCYDCRCASVSGELEAILNEYERRLTNKTKEKKDQDRLYLKNVFPNPLPHQGIHPNLQSR